MCSCLVANPLHYGFLVTQARFLLGKNRADLAVELAKAAVNANPSEYATWAILTESYIAINEYENVTPPPNVTHARPLVSLLGWKADRRHY
jgi:Chs5-Arf1p-binding protein BUD7/BCH1